MKKRLFKAILTLIVVDLLLIQIANIFLCLYFDKQIRENVDIAQNYIVNTLTKPVDNNLNLAPEFEKQLKLNQLRFLVNGYHGSATFAPGCLGIYDYKTGDTICESNESLVQVISDRTKGEKDKVNYFCSILNEEEVNAFLIKHRDDNISVKSISIKNLDCYITEMIATNMKNGDIIEETYVFKADNTEFETLIASENITLFAPMSNSAEILDYEGILLKYNDALDERNKERFDKINKAGPALREDSVIKWFYFSPDGDSYLTQIQKIYDPDGNAYNYVSSFSYNVRELTLNAVFEMIAISVVLAAVIFIVSEKIRRTKEKAIHR